MKKLVTGILGLTTILWLLGLWLQPPAPNMRAIMHEVYYLNGLWAWTLMALAVITAARPAWLLALVKSDPASLFAWHKGLGIAAAALSVVHWFSRPLFASMLSFLATESVQRFARQPAQGLLDAAWGGAEGICDPVLDCRHCGRRRPVRPGSDPGIAQSDAHEAAPAVLAHLPGPGRALRPADGDGRLDDALWLAQSGGHRGRRMVRGPVHCAPAFRSRRQEGRLRNSITTSLSTCGSGDFRAASNATRLPA